MQSARWVQAATAVLLYYRRPLGPAFRCFRLSVRECHVDTVLDCLGAVRRTSLGRMQRNRLHPLHHP